MSNSNLVSHYRWSPNHSGKRNKPITKITIHHVAGVVSVETLGNIFAPTSRYASSQYGIGFDGRIGQYVDEANRAWTSGNADNDNQAVTIEVSNSATGGQWPVSDLVLDRLIDLCVDICKRNAIKVVTFTGDATGTLTLHKYFQQTSCPGPYLESKMTYIAQQINARLNPSSGGGSLLFWRIQTGAFKDHENAIALERKLKAEEFDTYLITVDGLYKVQVGAFSDKSNADRMEQRLRKAGYETFLTTKGGVKATAPVAQKPTPVQAIKIGSKVKVRQGARDWSGVSLNPEVYRTTYSVIELVGDRAVIGLGRAVTAAIHKDNLFLV